MACSGHVRGVRAARCAMTCTLFPHPPPPPLTAQCHFVCVDRRTSLGLDDPGHAKKFNPTLAAALLKEVRWVVRWWCADPCPNLPSFPPPLSPPPPVSPAASPPPSPPPPLHPITLYRRRSQPCVPQPHVPRTKVRSGNGSSVVRPRGCSPGSLHCLKFLCRISTCQHLLWTSLPGCTPSLCHPRGRRTSTAPMMHQARGRTCVWHPGPSLLVYIPPPPHPLPTLPPPPTPPHAPTPTRAPFPHSLPPSPLVLVCGRQVTRPDPFWTHGPGVCDAGVGSNSVQRRTASEAHCYCRAPAACSSEGEANGG